MIRAGIYTRISQDREGAGLGVQRQELDCRELAERLGYQVVAVYSDNDTSAYSGKVRPGYEELLADVASGHIGTVIVWHTDRLHRSTTELETYIDVAGSIPTYSVKAGLLDLSTASGRMTARITGAVARHESEHKSERQRRKADELASKGLPLGGGRPFGYEKDGVTINEPEARELRAMAAKVLAGESLGSIIRDLNERGVLTTRGGRWGYTSLRSLLLRPRNCARMQHRGVVIGKAAWAPIISETDHDAVCAVLADPARRTTTTSARKHLLSGLLKCVCGAPMRSGWVSPRPGERHEMYRCSERGAGHSHRSKHKVERYVVAKVLDQLDAVHRPGADLSALESEREEINEKLDRSALLYAENTITSSQLAAITSNLRARLDDVTGRLTQAAGSQLEGTSGLTIEEWEALSLDRRRTIIDALMTITALPVGSGPLRADCGLAIKLRSDETPGNHTTAFGFRMPDAIAAKVRAASG